MSRTLLLALLASQGLLACVPALPPAPPADRDPSNPQAPEGAPAPAATSESEGDFSGNPLARYACRMHPEITSDQPGRCPKCGMNLERTH